MPRRNISLIVGLTVLCLMCAVKVSRHGRILIYAMDQVGLRYVEEVDQDKLFEGALAGMVSQLDAHSQYIGPEQSQEFQETLDRQFGGVGIQIVLDPDTNRLTVGSPLAGTPAHAAGILAGDVILGIDGQSTQGLSLLDAQARMRGRPGDPVTLTILHEGEQQPVEMEIVRAVIQVETVLGDTRNLDGSWDFFLEGHDRIGYLRINSFGDRTDAELAKVVRSLVERDVQGLILDLRDNPGGMLGAAIGVCDLFVESGPIVSTRRREGEIQYTARSEGTYSDLPMAVLVNYKSASASEIVAACLQDHQRAVIVGQRTFGKASVQEIIHLESNQGMLKLTTASYWRPSGTNIQSPKPRDEEDDGGVRPDPGCDVAIDDEQWEKLCLARLHRDIGQSNRKSDSEDGPEPFDVSLDPQLAKAVECVEEAIQRRRKPEPVEKEATE